MFRRMLLLLMTVTVITGLTAPCFAAKIAPPLEPGKGFHLATVDDAAKMHKDGATVVACHSHTTDYMKGHPEGTLYITCMVPADHKRVDVPLDKVLFDVNALPANKNSDIIMYCASDT
ncbi:MAG: hypothetical protein H8E79_03115 [Desulfobulbaceae bacterium]|uniref:Uncharacterized protein n=1 Tax=Candidatus Desulfatifera sulfidica TaxID=2841691 RepID=A0A8J6NA54_9BACT|nr:hypothetical protein [Candidatus Desulfatifera sulfidica]